MKEKEDKIVTKNSRKNDDNKLRQRIPFTYESCKIFQDEFADEASICGLDNVNDNKREGRGKAHNYRGSLPLKNRVATLQEIEERIRYTEVPARLDRLTFNFFPSTLRTIEDRGISCG